MNGADLDHRKIRVDYSITKRPHTPTPGMYMGRPTMFHARKLWKGQLKLKLPASKEVNNV